MPIPIPKSVQRAWESPTLMSWASMAVRAGGFLLVLPVLATRLPKADFELWLLFGTATALVLMATFGFDGTFVRLIAYALAGRPVAEMHDMATRWEKSSGLPDRNALHRVLHFLRRVFVRLGIFGFFIAAVLGFFALGPAIQRSTDPAGAWAAWFLVCLGSAATLYSVRFSCILQGFNRIAVLRRWEAIFGLGAVVVTLLAVLVSSRLLTLIATWQAIGLIGVWRNRWLALSIPEVREAYRLPALPDPELWRTVWPVSWRMGLTMLGSHGLIQASGIIYSLLPNPSQLAGYLLCLRLYQFLYAIAGVPFYASIPMLARLRASGDFDGQIALARRVMRRVYGTVLLGVTGVAMFANLLLASGKSDHRVDSQVWWVLGVSLIIQLYGGMLGGLYGLSNRVFGHLAVVAFGLSYYGSAYLLVPRLGDQGIALGLLIGCCVAAGFAAWKTYPALQVRPWQFERGVTVPAVALMILLALAGRAIAP